MPWLLLLLSLFSSARVFAQAAEPTPIDPTLIEPVPVEPTPVELDEEPELVLGEPDPSEGFGIVTLGPELALVDQGRGQRNRDHNGGAGVSMQLLTARQTWPVMVGLGFGLLAFDSIRELRLGKAAGTRHSTLEAPRWDGQPALQLRHAELVARCQPWWGPVRPYAELALGVAAFWHDGEDQQRFASVLYAATLGIDWRLSVGKPGMSGTWSIALTTSIKRLGTGPIERPLSAVVDGANGRRFADDWERARLGMWVPYLGLTLAIDSRHRARAPRPTTP